MRNNGFKLMSYADALAGAMGVHRDDLFADDFDKNLYWMKIPALRTAFTANVERAVPEEGDEFEMTDGERVVLQSIHSFPKKSRVIFLVGLHTVRN